MNTSWKKHDDGMFQSLVYWNRYKCIAFIKYVTIVSRYSAFKVSAHQLIEKYTGVSAQLFPFTILFSIISELRESSLALFTVLSVWNPFFNKRGNITFWDPCSSHNLVLTLHLLEPFLMLASFTGGVRHNVAQSWHERLEQERHPASVSSIHI